MTAPTIYTEHRMPRSGTVPGRRRPGPVSRTRAKVAAVGVGFSPTLRRWRTATRKKAIGATWAILAIRNAIEDAGVNPAEVEGLVFDPGTTTGAFWPEDEPVPSDFLAAFQNTSDPFDGLIQLSAEWLVKNMPELTGLKWTINASICMSMTAVAAIEAVGRGMGQTVVAVKGWHNVPGRYGQRGANAQDTVSGPGKYGRALAGPPVYGTAQQFQRYLHKYGKTHDMMAPFVVNSRSNGLKFPEGYWYQHRNNPLTTEEYLESRWVAEPANLYDNDIPIHTACAFVFTTAERARDLRNPPAYVLGHATGGRMVGMTTWWASRRAAPSTTWKRTRSGRPARPGGCTRPRASRPPRWTSRTPTTGSACSTCSGSRASASSASSGARRSTSSPARTSPSTGRRRSRPAARAGTALGSGRTRYWNWADTIQQIQGRAGERQIKKEATIGVTGSFMPPWSSFAVFSKDPSGGA